MADLLERGAGPVDLRVCVGKSCLLEDEVDVVVDTLLNGCLGWKGLSVGGHE